MRYVIDLKKRRKKFILEPGDYFASSQNVLLCATVGSCLAVCLYDKETKVLGMNHFVLPLPPETRVDQSARYGVFSLPLLLNAMKRRGGNPENYVAKVFGGGFTTLAQKTSAIGQANITFALKALEVNKIPVISQDVGGKYGRSITFDASDGSISVRKTRNSEINLRKGFYDPHPDH